MNTLHIKDVCQQLKINSQTVYYYEKIGLIPPPQRSESGYRLFTTEDIETLKFILRLKSLGLTLAEIRQLLNLRGGRFLSCEAVYNQLQKKINEINQKINQLENLKKELIPLLDESQTNMNNVNSDHQCQVLNRKN